VLEKKGTAAQQVWALTSGLTNPCRPY
jgi:hypothetical protein